MNPGFLVNIDRLAYPVCLLIKLSRLVFGGKTTLDRKVNDDVIVFKMMGIGSITRIFTTLRAQMVDLTHIHFYTLESNRELCEILEIPNVHFFRAGSLSQLIASSFRILSTLRKQAPDIIIDYERSSNLLTVFKSMITVFTPIRTVSFFNQKKDQIKGSDVQYKLAGRSIEELIELTIPYLPVHNDKVSFTEKREPITDAKHCILVNINASDYLSYRRYSQSGFGEVIKNLLSYDPSLKIYLIGAPNEKQYVQSCIDTYLSGIDNIVNCCGKWSLTQLVDALDTTLLLITNDSGPMHLAAMKDIPTITIWGPTTPDTFGYTDHPNMINIQSNSTCAPCFTHPKSKAARVCNGRIDCIKDIEPSQISDVAIKLLKKEEVTV